MQADVAVRDRDDPAGSTAATTLRATGPHHIVVVGGGAAGLELATSLGHRLAKRGKAQVTLIDRARTHIWKPLLHTLSGWRYQRRFYRWPVELRTMQRLMRYQRPETSGF